MNMLTLTMSPLMKRERKVRVEFDAERFERLAAGLGFFSTEFIASVDRAEREITQRKIKLLRNLKDLRRV